jgi:NTP pyrophosphatase (non-canonical NTP hydrolase)
VTDAPNVDRLSALQDRLRQFVAERDWQQFHDPKNLAMAIASEAGELLSELRWVTSEKADEIVREPERRERIEREVGDVAIALLLLCDRVGIDLLSAVDRKIALNAVSYPAQLSRGRADRPSGDSPFEAVVTPFARVIAVDWSGVAAGGHETIWLAEVVDGVLMSLENGRSRDELTDRLIEIARVESNIVVGLDFAFAFPQWFSKERGLTSIGALWELVSNQGEAWLRDCEAPFWGRPGRKKPPLVAEYRQTELDVGRNAGGQAKSVFHVGGAGAVGTGSLRGMPHLARLQREGFSIWPFDKPRRPLVVEIYPLLLTGAVVKSSLEARESYLEGRFPTIADELRRTAASSEDAFDAAVSALVMSEHAVELASLQSNSDPMATLEGRIWAPAGA